MVRDIIWREEIAQFQAETALYIYKILGYSGNTNKVEYSMNKI